MNHQIDGHLCLTEVETTDHHISALFDLLRKRREHHRISHGTAPDFESHRNFVLSHTYRHWFLVSFDAAFIGTVYLTNDNVLGIFVEDDYLDSLGQIIGHVVETFDPLPAIPSLRNSAFTINLSPRNTAYAAIVKELGGRLLQQSYALPRPEHAAADAKKDEPR